MYFLENVACEFSSRVLNEINVNNTDETHFIVNVDDGNTFGFGGDQKVKYVKITSSGEGMTVLVCISGGKIASIEARFMVFMNENSSYSIEGVQDYISGVCFCSSLKGCLDRNVMLL